MFSVGLLLFTAVFSVRLFLGMYFYGRGFLPLERYAVLQILCNHRAIVHDKILFISLHNGRKSTIESNNKSKCTLNQFLEHLIRRIALIHKDQLIIFCFHPFQFIQIFQCKVPFPIVVGVNLSIKDDVIEYIKQR